MNFAPRLWLPLLASLFLTIAAPARVRAQEPPPFVFAVTNGEASLTQYTGTATEVIIPGTFGGLPVTAIGEYVFFSRGLTSVVIPDSVVVIGTEAFAYCRELTGITLPDHLSRLGDRAFQGTGLIELTLPATLTSLGRGVFADAVALGAIAVAEENPVYRSADGLLFRRDSAVLVAYPPGNGSFSYDIPDGVTAIGVEAFGHCPYLREVTIPDSVTDLGNGAFEECQKLNHVTIPGSVTHIGANAFLLTGLTDITIPGSVTQVGAGAFYSCSQLTGVTLSEGVISLGDGVFTACPGLKKITLPASLTNLGVGVFDFSGLTAFTVLPGNPAYRSGAGVLFNTDTTTLVAYPPARPGAPYGVPFSITSIGDRAFAWSSGLTGVLIPAGVTRIGAGAFANSVLAAVTIPDTVTVLGDHAFDGCGGLTQVKLPDQLTQLGDHVLANCPRLADITIPESVTTLGNGAFAGSGLEIARLPAGLTHIGDYAFFGSPKLTAAVVPVGLVSIGDHAFEGCGNLTAAWLPYAVTHIGERAFAGTRLGAFALDEANGSFSTVDGVLFNHDQTTLIAFPPGNAATSYQIPGRVTHIGGWAFQNSGLTQIAIPEGVTDIGEGAFMNCQNLTNVTFPSRVTELGRRAFAGCAGLTRVTIPASVTGFGDWVFGGCPSLTDLFFLGDNPGIGQYTFDEPAGTISLHYLPGTRGWATTVFGMDTAPWTLPAPMILPGSLGRGGLTNHFSFRVSWATNLAVVVETATELATPVWQPLLTNRLTDGVLSFSDPEAGSYPGRVYRARSE